MPGLDPSALTPEMTIEVTLGDFHATHDRAGVARERTEKGKELDKLSVPGLRQILADLRAGQRLTDAEDGPDFMFAADYSLSILAVVAELRGRGEQV